MPAAAVVSTSAKKTAMISRLTPVRPKGVNEENIEGECHLSLTLLNEDELLAEAVEDQAVVENYLRVLAAEKIAAGAAIAAEKAAEAAQAAAEKVEEVAAPEKKKRSKLKTLLVVTGIAAVAAVVVKKMQSSGESENWQSSYTPTPAPRPTAVPDEAAGASPDEAIADQAEAPHPVTTPEDPAEVVDVADEPKK